MSGVFKKADRRKKKLRMALDGPAGSGKTLTALRCAMVVARHEAMKAGRPGQTKVAVIDTESGSASIYQGDKYDGFPIEFDVIELSDFSPTRYSELTREAGRMGYDVLVIDSLSHAWSGKGGALEMVDHKATQNKGNSFSGWKDITPLQNEMIDTLTRSSCHLFATMRTKTEWVLETNEKGKLVPRKVGMAPVQRQGVEYEFDIVLDIDEDHVARVSKSRCSAIADKASSKPGAEFMGAVVAWLDQGSDVPQDVLDAAGLVDAATFAPAGGTGNGAAAGAAANQPATVSEDDMAARLAAKRAALQPAAGAATTTPATTPAATVNTPPLVDKSKVILTPAMVEISSLFDQLEAPQEARNVAYGKRGATSLAELSPEGSESLLAGLRALIAGKAPPIPPSLVETPPAAVEDAPSPAIRKTMRAPEMITGKQQEIIRKLFELLQIPAEARVAAYQRRGVAALAELTFAHATEMIVNLEARLSPADRTAMELHGQFLSQPVGTAGTAGAAADQIPFDGGVPISGAA